MKPERIQEEHKVFQDPSPGIEDAHPSEAPALPRRAELKAEIAGFRFTFQVFAPETAVVT